MTHIVHDCITPARKFLLYPLYGIRREWRTRREEVASRDLERVGGSDCAGCPSPLAAAPSGSASPKLTSAMPQLPAASQKPSGLRTNRRINCSRQLSPPIALKGWEQILPPLKHDRLTQSLEGRGHGIGNEEAQLAGHNAVGAGSRNLN
jgi:hypothetical protein